MCSIRNITVHYHSHRRWTILDRIGKTAVIRTHLASNRFTLHLPVHTSSWVNVIIYVRLSKKIELINLQTTVNTEINTFYFFTQVEKIVVGDYKCPCFNVQRWTTVHHISQTDTSSLNMTALRCWQNPLLSRNAHILILLGYPPTENLHHPANTRVYRNCM